MKTKYLWLGVGALVVAGGLGYARTAWRAHRQIITLHVRSMPLRDVLRKIERQTREKIRAEQDVDTRVTLNVTDKPLGYVLERLSEQAGARCVTVYAVYHSSKALKSLESALRGEGKIETAGWTKIAPDLNALRREPQEAAAVPATAAIVTCRPEPCSPSPSSAGVAPERRGGEKRRARRGCAGGSLDARRVGFGVGLERASGE